ncbi:MAG: ROK family transcriptional regulator [Pseudomonadota bacterium]
MNRHVIRDLQGGSDQTGLRDQNARLVLSYIRRHGALAGAEIARRSGLSAQTVSNILRALQADGLVAKGDAVKGKVGKPSVPVALNPVGAHAVGLNIGRRSAEFVLVDFLGTPLSEFAVSYPFPTPDCVFPFLSRCLRDALAAHPEAATTLAGVGVSMPFRLWEWHQIVEAPEGDMDAWRSLDVAAEVEAVTGRVPVIQNDATSACVAEHLLGRGHEYLDFAYLFVGAFIGGGLVLNGKVVEGRTGNAGAFGPLPVPDGLGGTRQLLTTASLYTLEARLKDAGGNADALREASADWHALGAALDDWIAATARDLAIAAAAAVSIVEIEAVLIDGAVPRWVAERLVAGVADELDRIDMTGVEKPTILLAEVGASARALGAALLPIHARYFPA